MANLLSSTNASPTIIVVSSSLNRESRSRMMAKYAVGSLARFGADAHLLDLAQLEIHPYPRSEEQPVAKEAFLQFNAAHAWVLASPLYNFGASGVLLNFLHYALDSDFGRWKPFVLMASMGGQRSALGLDHLARMLVYEVSAVQVGPTISNIGDTGVNRQTGEIMPDLIQRMDTQFEVLVHYAHARLAMDNREQRYQG